MHFALMTTINFIIQTDTHISSHAVMQILRHSRYQVSLYWQDLAYCLGVPTELLNMQRDRVKNNTFQHWEALEECIDWWIRNYPNSSWEQLLDIVKRLDKKAANEMKKILLIDQRGRQSSMSRAINCFHIVFITPVASLLIILFQSVKTVIATSAFSLSSLVIHMVTLKANISSSSTETHSHIKSNVYSDATIANNQEEVAKMPSVDERIWIAGDTGQELVEKCIERLKEKDLLSGHDEEFMRRLAHVMSRNGTALFKLEIDGGIWQISRYGFAKTQNERLPLTRKCEELLGIEEWNRVSKIRLEKPIYSAVAARLYLSTFEEPVPPSCKLQEQQDYWFKYYMYKHEAKDYMGRREFENSMKTIMITSNS